MLNERSLLSQFLHFVAATVASLMVFSLYSIVDGLMVAKGVGEYAMAAVNLAVPFTNVLFSIGVIFAVGIGLITMCIRLWGAYPEGMSFAILIMNACVPLINKYVKPRRFGLK